MSERDLVQHGLAIKRHASADAVAELLGLPLERVAPLLADATTTLRAVEVNGAYVLTPLAGVALEARYDRIFSAQRSNLEFTAAYEGFEKINRVLKQIITDWQTIKVGGTNIANDHSDAAHDAAIIDRLGALHEQFEPLLTKLARHLPRLEIYGKHLTHALEAAEDGDVAWVSDIRRSSYHTLWFELHEDLLRIMGRVRKE